MRARQSRNDLVKKEARKEARAQAIDCVAIFSGLALDLSGFGTQELGGLLLLFCQRISAWFAASNS